MARPPVSMKSLSASLKQTITSTTARGSPWPAPPPSTLDHLFTGLRTSAVDHGVGSNTWLTLSSATLVTLNSPDSLKHLYTFATRDSSDDDQVRIAALMREVGLKCISFNGIPRTINNLAALRSAVPPHIQERLSTTPTREPSDPSKVSAKAKQLWTSIYGSQSDKLISLLSASHPDLPVHILNSHYGPVLADPIPSDSTPPNDDDVGSSTGTVGRVLTSVIAIACLRAQGGVGLQVMSHVLGLRKSSLDSEAIKGVGKGGEWLTGEDGAEWVLKWVDEIVAVVSQGQGSNFATRPIIKAKL